MPPLQVAVVVLIMDPCGTREVVLCWFACEAVLFWLWVRDPFLGRFPVVAFGFVFDVCELDLGLDLDCAGGKRLVQGGDGSMIDRAVILMFSS